MAPPSDERPRANPARDLARRVALEELVARISRRFVALAAEALDGAIQATLRDLGEFVDADRSFVFRFDHQARTAANTHEWCADEIPSQRENLQGLNLADFSWSTSRMQAETVLEIPRVADLPDTAQVEREVLQAQSIQSSILVGMFGRTGGLDGFIGFDAVRQERPWQPEDAYLLEVVGGILAAAFEHQRMVAALTASEARHRATLAAIPDLLFILDQDGRVLDFQAPGDQLLAVPLDQVQGSLVWDILPPRHREDLARAMAAAAATGRCQEFHYRLILDGKPREFEARLTRRMGGEYLVLARDATDRLEADAALRRLALQLTAAEEDQRRELALQLHDGVGQELSGLMYRLQALKMTSQPQPERLAEALKLLQVAMQRTQDLTFDMSPPVLHELGLAAALRTLVARFDEQTPIRFQMVVEGDDRPIEHSLGVLLYRIARELLVNVVKHAGAARAELHLAQRKAMIILTVDDDGCGLDPDRCIKPPASGRGGFGLFSIRQRLWPLGGKLKLGSDHGARVTVTLPRQPRDQSPVVGP